VAGVLNFRRFKPQSGFEAVAALVALGILGWFFYAQVSLHSPQNQIDIPFLGSRPHAAHSTIHNNDFKHIFLGASLLKTGGNPYEPRQLFAEKNRYGLSGGINPFVYPVFTGIALNWLVPSGAAQRDSFDRAVCLWSVVQYLMLLGALVYILGLMEPGQFYLKLAVALLLAATSWPLTRTLTAGQLNLAVLVIFSVTAHMLALGRWRAAAFCVALGAWFKLTPGILLLYFICRRQFKTAGWFVVFATGLLMYALLLVPWSVHLDYLPLVRSMGYGKSTWAQFGMAFHIDPFNQSINAFLLHLLSENAVTRAWVEWPPVIANGLTWIAALALLSVVGWQSCRPAAAGEKFEFDRRERLIFSLWVFLGLLLPSLMWDHYLIILLLPQLFVFDALLAMRREVGGGVRRFWVYLVLWVLACLLMNWKFPFPVERYQAGMGGVLAFLNKVGLTDYRSGLGILVLSHKLFGVLILFGLNGVLVNNAKAPRSKGAMN